MKNKSLKSKTLAFLIVVFALIYFTPVRAQISEGGLPPSYGTNQLRSTIQPYKVAIDFDVNKLLAEDDEDEALGLPPRCAKIIPAGLSAENTGEWLTLPDGQRIWRLEIEAPDALAILLLYDQFSIPEGGKLFIYNPDYSTILGAYTSKTNTKKAEFATEFLPGDRLILEYVAPASPGEVVTPQLKISGIAYGYNHLKSPAGKNTLFTRWQSSDCMINVNCSEGDDWQDQKKGVARIAIPTSRGIGLCSGTLVNNTSFDLDPLFLSAHHCYEGVTQAQLNQAVYYFHYEWPGCENLNTDPECPTMVGAQMLVDLDIQGASDGALLRLNDPVPEEYEVYYNGWDRRNIAATSGVGIHHPGGDVKKISTFTSPVISSTWDGSGALGAIDAHWELQFSATANGHSVVEGGSSGSPLFNQDGLVVGTLTGGNTSYCYLSGIALYGKLWYHWGQAAQKMASYLDPVGLGAESIEGTYINNTITRADFSIEKQEIIYTSKLLKFTNTSRNADSWEWTFEGGEPAVSNEENPPLIAFNTPGICKITLTVNKGTETEHTRSKEIEVITKEYICPEEATIGEGTNQAQFPLGAVQRHVLSSALYTAEEIGMEPGGTIRSIAWNAGAAVDQDRSFSVYLKETDENELTKVTWESEIAGATLVYENAGTWTSPAGWVTLPLSKGFRYSGKKNLKVIVRTFSYSSGSNSACYYTPSTNRHLRWTVYNSDIPSGNGTLNNDRPNIRIRIDASCGAYEPVADFLTGNFTAIEEADFLTEESIVFTDQSTGPVVNWEWSFPGAVPENSRNENPTITYSEPGTYTVTLKVSNHLGTNTLQRTIRINGRPPGIDFSSSSEGFTTYPDYGQLLSYAGGAVSFQDESTYNPNHWNWALEGINSGAFENKLVTVDYPAGKNTYSVALTASNTAGSATKEIAGYVKVGGTSGIWNIPYGDTGDTYHLLPENTYLTGTNGEYGIIAEKFTNGTAGNISQIDLMIKVFEKPNSFFRNYSISVYDEKDDQPGTALSTVSLNGSAINPSGYTTIVFPEPVPVLGNFYIEIKGLSSLGTNIAIGASEESNPTVYVYKNQVWTPLEKVDPENRKISLNVVPTFTYTSGLPLEFLNTTVVKKKNVDKQPDVIQFITNENDWSAHADKSWINVEKEVGGEHPALRITCDENRSNWRSGTILLSAGDRSGAIHVIQTGANPSDLRARYDNENHQVVLIWENSGEEGTGSISYNVYRGEELIAHSISSLTYTDTDFQEAPEICYTVSAIYNSDKELESTLSEPVCISTTGIKDIEDASIPTIYPNPADNYLHIKSQSPVKEIVLQDVQGRRIAVVDNGNKDEIVLPVAHLTKGIYLLRIQTTTGITNHKVVKK
jgi:PKD repeat protein